MGSSSGVRKKSRPPARFPASPSDGSGNASGSDSSDFESPARRKHPPAAQRAEAGLSCRVQPSAAPKQAPSPPADASAAPAVMRRKSTTSSAPTFHLQCDDSSSGSDSEDSTDAPGENSDDDDDDVRCMGTQPTGAAPDMPRPIGALMSDFSTAAYGAVPTTVAAAAATSDSAAAAAAAERKPWAFLMPTPAAPLSLPTLKLSDALSLLGRGPCVVKRPRPPESEAAAPPPPSMPPPPAAGSIEAAAGAFLEAARGRARAHGGAVPVALVQVNPKRSGTQSAARCEQKKRAVPRQEYGCGNQKDVFPLENPRPWTTRAPAF